MSRLRVLSLALLASLAACSAPPPPDPSPRAIPPARLEAFEERLAEEEVGPYRAPPRPPLEERLQDARNAVAYGEELVTALTAVGEAVSELELEAGRSFLADAREDLARLLTGESSDLRQVGGGFPGVRWASGRFGPRGTYRPGHPPDPIDNVQGLIEVSEPMDMTEAFGWTYGDPTTEQAEAEALEEEPIVIGEPKR